MEINNSYSFYKEIVCELYRDIAECYNVTRRMQRAELRVIEARFSKEGISFLTKCLPRFGKAVDSALSSGTRLSVIGFTVNNGSKVPQFLGWLLSRVFDASGCELDQPDPVALKHFRQLVYLVYKLEIPYDTETEQSVLGSFVQIDSELPQPSEDPAYLYAGDSYDFGSCDTVSAEWLKQARALITRVVSALDPTGAEIRPRHGPGVVATGEHVCEKSFFSRIYAKLDAVYSFTEWFMFNLSHVADSIPAKNPRVTLVDQATAKVVLVPKDSRGPRLISCEPLEVQWIQQGLGRALMATIESHSLTRGRVNFADQGINRELAMLGSKNNQWVTLDMKDASDRVSLALVNNLFQGHPRLLEALLASRSQSTRLPSGAVIPLKKYAPMGSALCFPVESLIFWALAVSAIKQDSFKTWAQCLRSVYVYGDDIIMRKEDYTILLRLFPIVGLKFNESKCCVARSFRESCGCDAYFGVDVTPIRLKTTWSPRRSNPKCLASYVAFSNAMYLAGHFRTVDLIRKSLVKVYGKIPYTNKAGASYDAADEIYREVDHPGAPAFLRSTFVDLSYAAAPTGIMFFCYEPSSIVNNRLGIRKRYNKRLQILEYSCLITEPIKVQTRYDGYPEMLRRTSSGRNTRSIRMEGEREGRHGGVYALVRRNRLKRTWAGA